MVKRFGIILTTLGLLVLGLLAQGRAVDSLRAEPQLFTLRINAGDLPHAGTYRWEGDQAWNGAGWGYVQGFGGSFVVPNDITGTDDDPVYQSQRYGDFAYRVTVPPGVYRVTLHLAETFVNATNERVFDVRAEGLTQWKNVDAFRMSGGKFKAIDVSAGVTVCDGELNLEFVRLSGYESPSVGGIVIEQVAAPGDAVWYYNSGGREYTDTLGVVWQADAPYCPGLGGYVIEGATDHTNTYSVFPSQDIAETDDDPLYRDERDGEPFEYRFDVPNGTYRVTLRFAELFFTTAGRRVFHIDLEETRVAADVDLYAEATRFAAFDLGYTVTVLDGQLNVVLVPRVGYPSLSAIAVVPTQATPTPSPTGEASPTMTATATPTPEVTPSPSATPACTVVGDVDGSLMVDAPDVVLVAQAFRQEVPSLDFVGEDGVVLLDDVMFVASRFGQSCTPG